jgi:hypothetical protein
LLLEKVIYQQNEHQSFGIWSSILELLIQNLGTVVAEFLVEDF